MSTNRTENYQLHVWGAEDEERLAELNENFAKLDAVLDGLEEGKSRIVSGSFICTGVDLHIDLGGRPAAVLVENEAGVRYTSSGNVYGGLVCGSKGLKGYVMLDDTGFTLKPGGSGNNLNGSGDTKTFLAVMD